jgi:hypothetical protein
MLKGFIDDSGSEPSSPQFVLAGYVLPAEEWAKFSDAWDKQLALGKPIRYLHMKETGRDFKGGQFDGWAVDEIDEKLLSLAEVINARQPISLAAHARWSEYQTFQAVSDRAKFIPSPYKALFHEVIRIMYNWGERMNNPQSVDFIFDEQGDVGFEAASWYLETKAAFPPYARPFFGSTPEFKDDLLVLPLQAADMLAWFQRRQLCQPVTRPLLVKAEQLLTEFFAVGSELAAQHFEKAAIDFEKVARYRESGIPIEYKNFDDKISDILKVPRRDNILKPTEQRNRDERQPRVHSTGRSPVFPPKTGIEKRSNDGRDDAHPSKKPKP